MPDLGPARSPTRALPQLVVLAVCVSAVFLFVLGGQRNDVADGFTIALVSTVFGASLVSLRSSGVHALSLFAMVTYAHAAIFVVRPLYNVVNPLAINPFTGGPQGQSYFDACVVAAVGYVSFCVGYVAVRNSGATARRHAELDEIDPDLWRRLRPVLGLAALAGIGLYSVYVAQVGLSGYVRLFTGGRSVELSGALSSVSGYFTTGLQFALGAVLFFFFRAATSGRRGLAVIYVVILILLVAPQLASGSRSVFIPVTVAIVVLVQRISPGVFTPVRLLIAGPVAFVALFIAPRLTRTAATENIGFFDALRDAFLPENLLEGFVGGLDMAMVDAFAVQVAAQQQGTVEQSGGSTYAGALLSFVPRSFWPGKPSTVDQQLNSALFPATNSEGIGFSFGWYSEPYYNFGFVGVALVMLLIGVVLSRLENLGESRNPFGFFIFALIVAYIFPLVRGSITFDSQRLLVAMVPVLLAMWVTGVSRNRSNAVGLMSDRVGLRRRP